MSANIHTLLALALVLVTTGYGIFSSRTLLQGPVISLANPRNGAHITDMVYTVEGTVRNFSRIRINGRPIAPTITGAFSEQLLTPHGYSTVVVEAENRFGQHNTVRLEVVGAPERTLPTESRN